MAEPGGPSRVARVVEGCEKGMKLRADTGRMARELFLANGDARRLWRQQVGVRRREWVCVGRDLPDRQDTDARDPGRCELNVAAVQQVIQQGALQHLSGHVCGRAVAKSWCDKLVRRRCDTPARAVLAASFNRSWRSRCLFMGS